MAPELKQMRDVVAIAKEQSFSRAAENLHVAQQAVSQQVRLVKESLGIQLFERSNRGVTITAAGEVFVHEARRALNAADRVAPRAQAAARGKGVGLVVASLAVQLPGGVRLVGLAPPVPTLTIDLIWSTDRQSPGIRRLLATAGRLADKSGWL